MFKKVISIWKREVINDGITKIESEFLEQVIDYLKINSLKISNSNTNVLQRELTIREMNLIVKILNNLHKIRCNKVFLEIMDKGEINTNAVTVFEKESYMEILNRLKTEFINLEEQIKISIKEKGLTIVRFLSSISQFLGIDLKPYGPYEAEDVATIPIRNAVILSQKGVCIMLE